MATSRSNCQEAAVFNSVQLAFNLFNDPKQRKMQKSPISHNDQPQTTRNRWNMARMKDEKREGTKRKRRRRNTEQTHPENPMESVSTADIPKCLETWPLEDNTGGGGAGVNKTKFDRSGGLETGSKRRSSWRRSQKKHPAPG